MNYQQTKSHTRKIYDTSRNYTSFRNDKHTNSRSFTARNDDLTEGIHTTSAGYKIIDVPKTREQQSPVPDRKNTLHHDASDTNRKSDIE
jgi:hypothetical protein